MRKIISVLALIGATLADSLTDSSAQVRQRAVIPQPPPSGTATIDPTSVDKRPPGPAPVVTVAAVSPTSVTLRWLPVPSATGYTVIRDPASRPEVLTPTLFSPPPAAGTVTYTHSGIMPNTAVAYAVIADFGSSSPNAPGRSTVGPITTTPAVNPGGIRAEMMMQGSVNLTWDSVPGATSYWVTRNGGPVAPVTIKAPGYRDLFLPPGDYNYQVIARYSAGAHEFEGDVRNVPSVKVMVKKWKGRYRVTANGFVVNHQTKDHMLNVDGVGDEVYLAAYVQKLTVNGYTEFETHTATYGGDNDTQTRIRAGSASSSAGLATGDSVPAVPNPWARHSAMSLPWEIWSGELTQAMDCVVITPTIWEWDGKIHLWNDWLAEKRKQTKELHQGNLNTLLASETIQPRELGEETFGNLANRDLWDDVISGTTGGSSDRPIGLSRKTARRFNLPSTVVVLTVDAIEAALSNPSPKGAGVIAIQLVDHPELEGNYTLYLQVETIP